MSDLPKNKYYKRPDGKNDVGKSILLEWKSEEWIDRAVVFGRIAATHKDMAASLGISVDTVGRAMKRYDDPFYKAYSEGLAETCNALRTKQVTKALSGDNTMLIWCGKNILGQSDKVDNTIRNPEGGEFVIKWKG